MKVLYLDRGEVRPYVKGRDQPYKFVYWSGNGGPILLVGDSSINYHNRLVSNARAHDSTLPSEDPDAAGKLCSPTDDRIDWGSSYYLINPEDVSGEIRGSIRAHLL